MSLVSYSQTRDLIIMSSEEVLIMRVAQISNNDAAAGN